MAVSQKNARYAGFWLRVLAGIIDWIIIDILLGIIGIIVAHTFPEHAYLVQYPHAILAGTFSGSTDIYTILTWTQVIYNVIWLSYFSILESSRWQASIGMKVCGLKITDDNYRRISFLRALGREIATYLSMIIFFIGFIMIAFTKRKQGLHDMIASTYVIKN